MKNKEQNRLILDMSKFGIEIFDEFGKYNYINTQSILPTHQHPKMIEICYLAKGYQEYFVEKEVFKLFGGDIFMTFPDEVHGTGNNPEMKGELYWMVLKAPIKDTDYLGLRYCEAESLFANLLKLSIRKFKGSVECEQLLKQIINLYFSDCQDELSKIEMNNLLVSFLLHVIRAGRRANFRIYSSRITKTIDYVEENIFEIIDLEVLAERCNLSLSRFKHLFKEEVGIPPSEYIIRRKIEKAKTLLEKHEMNVKDIAYDLGFTSPAYFSTVFKQYIGYSPTEHTKGERL